MEIKALIAGSSAMVRRNIARSLNEIGVRNVVEATDSNQAIELVEKNTFDVAFVEWNIQIGAGENWSSHSASWTPTCRTSSPPRRRRN